MNPTIDPVTDGDPNYSDNYTLTYSRVGLVNANINGSSTTIVDADTIGVSLAVRHHQ